MVSRSSDRIGKNRLYRENVLDRISDRIGKFKVWQPIIRSDGYLIVVLLVQNATEQRQKNMMNKHMAEFLIQEVRFIKKCAVLTLHLHICAAQIGEFNLVLGYIVLYHLHFWIVK